jgi:DNA-directed RNA polymerase specialized sigma24 family protein
MAHIPFDDMMTWSNLPTPIREKVATRSLEEEAVEKETRDELAKILGPGITKYIERVFTKLAPNEGVIVVAREIFRMSNAELAALLYKTESNVRKAHSKGMRRLGE